jgi:hypothetical protein
VRVVADAVIRRQETGKQAGVCGQRQWRHGRGLIEEDAFARQPLEVRERDVHESIGRQSIGAGRVEGDHDHATWCVSARRDTQRHSSERDSAHRDGE